MSIYNVIIVLFPDTNRGSKFQDIRCLVNLPRFCTLQLGAPLLYIGSPPVRIAIVSVSRSYHCFVWELALKFHHNFKIQSNWSDTINTLVISDLEQKSLATIFLYVYKISMKLTKHDFRLQFFQNWLTENNNWKKLKISLFNKRNYIARNLILSSFSHNFHEDSCTHLPGISTFALPVFIKREKGGTVFEFLSETQVDILKKNRQIFLWNH